MMKERKLTLKTAAGRKWLLAISILVIFISGFTARLINTDFGKVKIEVFNIDARGATINGELMYPAGTSSDDSLPCVIAVHGTGCTYGVVRHFAIEMARRGYVAMAVSCYGAGLSEQPLYDEAGHGTDIGKDFHYGDTSSGLLDCLNFARSLAFVDDTRIGMTGHSMGSRVTQGVVMLDCSLYTYNDIMINVLHDTFGETFTEDEINTDAAVLAAERLTPEELAYYNCLAGENRTAYDSRLKAIFPMGGTLPLMTPPATVSVGGHDVTRNYQVNVALCNGSYDKMSKTFPVTDYAKEGWYTSPEDIAVGKWYAIDDVTGTSKILGDFDSLSITADPDFAAAIGDRSARTYIENPETHSKNFFSIMTTADGITFFEQTLNYSNGNLTDGTVPMSATNQVWYWARIFNFTALLGMIGMMFPLLAMLWGLKSYGPSMALVAEPADGFSKKRYWIFGAAAVIFTGLVAYYANGHFQLASGAYFSLSGVHGAVVKFIIGIGIFSLVSLIANGLITKKAAGNFGLAPLNLKMSVVNILKGVLIACVLIFAGYVSLMISEYLFNEDYRLWMAIITEMKVDYWLVAIRYALVFIVPYLLIGAAVNYNVRTDIPEWKDTLITVIVNSLGIWLLALINLISIRAAGTVFSDFFVSFQLLIFVPITVYISRKMYTITKNIWVGAVFNALLVAWSMTSELGVHTIYAGQNWLSIFFNV